MISTARYDQPFYRNSSSPKFSNTSLATFIATSSRSPLCIPPNVCLPAAPADAIYSVGISRSLFPTCEQHLKDHNTALTLLETTVVDTLVLALGHTPTRRFLAIYRPDASATSIMSIKSALDMDYPLLLSRGADVLFMPDSEALSDARFELSPGTTAEMLSLASFGSLSTRDDRPAQLICAPLAVQPQGEHRKLQEPPAPSILANESSVDPPLASESEVDSEEDDEFAAVPPRTWWWWDAICHFFVGLWYSIRGQQQTDVSDDETSDGDPLVTPPDETTPLLMVGVVALFHILRLTYLRPLTSRVTPAYPLFTSTTSSRWTSASLNHPPALRSTSASISPSPKRLLSNCTSTLHRLKSTRLSASQSEREPRAHGALPRSGSNR